MHGPGRKVARRRSRHVGRRMVPQNVCVIATAPRILSDANCRRRAATQLLQFPSQLLVSGFNAVVNRVHGPVEQRLTFARRQARNRVDLVPKARVIERSLGRAIRDAVQHANGDIERQPRLDYRGED